MKGDLVERTARTDVGAGTEKICSGVGSGAVGLPALRAVGLQSWQAL